MRILCCIICCQKKIWHQVVIVFERLKFRFRSKELLLFSGIHLPNIKNYDNLQTKKITEADPNTCRIYLLHMFTYQSFVNIFFYKNSINKFLTRSKILSQIGTNIRINRIYTREPTLSSRI
jgi:hypothetical protein